MTFKKNKSILSLLLVFSILLFFSSTSFAATENLSDLKLKWVDSGTIESTENYQGTSWIFSSPKKEGNTTTFYRANDPDAGNPTNNKCQDTLSIRGPVTTTAQSTSATLIFYTYTAGVGGCENATKDGNPYTQSTDGTGIAYTVSIQNPDNAQLSPGEGSSQNEDAAAAAEEAAGGCDDALSPFGWILCPVINIANNLYEWFLNLVNDLLYFEQSKYVGNDLQNANRSFVALANVVIVLIGLVMIVSQIFGFQIFDAYTVKKILPRIVIGAILIQLSWPLFTLAIQLTNAIGTGIYWLMLAPFEIPFGDSNFARLDVLIGGNDVGNGEGGADAAQNVAGTALGLGVLVGAGFVAFATGWWISIIVAIVGVIISLMVAVFTLIAREVILIILLATAPLALAFWILPGLNKFWNLWWNTFIKLLVMYPLIMLLIAGGTIAAFVLGGGDAGSSSSQDTDISVNKFAAIIAYFIPIFFIGATFKFAGGVLASTANLAGKIGDKGRGFAKGIGDRQRTDWKGRMGAKYDGDKATRSRLNNALARTASGNYLNTTRAQAQLASTAQKYSNDREAEYAFLQKKAVESISAQTKDSEGFLLDSNGQRRKNASGNDLHFTEAQAKYLEDEVIKAGEKGDMARAKSATKQLLARSDFNPGLEAVKANNPNGVWDKLMADGEIASGVSSARKDLFKGDSSFAEKMSAEDFLKQDKSFWAKMQKDGKFRDSMLDGKSENSKNFLREIERLNNDQQLYRGLNAPGKQVLANIFGAQTGGPPQTENYRQMPGQGEMFDRNGNPTE